MSVIGWMKNKFSGSSAEQHLAKARKGSLTGQSGLAKSAGVGAGVGAAVGGALGGLSAHNAIKDVPVDSVTLTWEEPVTQQELLGYVPEDRYRDSWGFTSSRPPAFESRDFGYSSECWGWNSPTSGPETVPVYRDNPTGAMRSVTRTFSGHGPHSVEMQTKTIKDFRMDGYSEDVTAYGSYKSEIVKEPFSNETTREEVWKHDGCFLEHEPNISWTSKGSYEQPKVRFNHGVNVAGRVIAGMGIGAVVGAVSGAAFWALSNK